MIACPGCGAGMRFDPDTQHLKCEYCGSLEPARKKIGSGDAKEQQTFESTIFTCKQCGGELISDSDTAMTFCSYCGSSMVLEGRLTSIQAPSRVIPFKKNRELCEENYKKLIKNAVYAPKSMREDSVIECFRGIYMPYWVYDFEHEGPATIEGTKHYRRGDYEITDHYALDAMIESTCEGLSFDASSSFSDSLSSAIAPYDMEDGEEFSEGFLAGFYADVADVDSSLYYEDMKGTYVHNIGKEMANIPLFSGKGPQSGTCKLNGELSAKQYMAYFPVWFLAIRQKDKVSYAVVNGQTGKVAADIPIDYKKYLFGSLLVAIPLFLLFNMLFTLTPAMMLGINLIVSIAGLVITSGELNQLYLRDLQMDDKALVEKKWSGISMNQMDEEKPKKTDSKNKKSMKSVASVLTSGAFVVFYVLLRLEVNTAFMLGALGVFVALFAVNMIVPFVEQSLGNRKPQSFTMKQPFLEKLSTIWKSLLAIIVSVVVLIWHPIYDIWYYGGVFVSMVCLLLSFWDLVTLHNKLTKRKPPQMNKRGGDEAWQG